MKYSEQEAGEKFKLVMQQCKRERRAKTKLTNRNLASQIQISENYLSAFESARAIPSVTTFFRYLMASGFDLSPLLSMEIKNAELLKINSPLKTALLQKLYTCSEAQIAFLTEQSKLADLFDFKLIAIKEKLSP